ncbi:MAG TPA: hypothetical protein VD731_03355 [Nitrosopumilaceae archaeon]|nr:hypothetical protein [Nitrosopumilaceae archaeon]
MKHYLHKGIWARVGLIDLLIDETRKYSEKLTQGDQSIQFGLTNKEITSALQISIISHIMMLIEDIAVFCKSIGEGKIDYYKYLDSSGDEDLGQIIKKFYDNIKQASDEQIAKILSYADVNSFEIKLNEEKEIVMKIIKLMIGKSREFFERAIFFRENHIKIYRRYKHAGFPILLAQQLPPSGDVYKGYEFAALGLTSRTSLQGEIVPLPYSKKAIESYTNLKKDIFSFLGNVLNYKMICIERKVNGLIPHKNNLFGIKISKKEEEILDDVWKRIEIKHPISQGQSEIGVSSQTEILRWYEEIEITSKRLFPV